MCDNYNAITNLLQAIFFSLLIFADFWYIEISHLELCCLLLFAIVSY